MVQGMPPFRHTRFPFRHSLRKQGIQKYIQPRMAPRFAARVTRVRVSTPVHYLSRAPLINLANLILYV